jgi:hypothetical protein
MLTRLRNEEDGLAMVISLMVAMVILILSTVVVAQSLHTLDASGYDRRRLTSVSAAEAGTNFYYQYFQTTPAVSLSCAAITRTVASSPAPSTFTATPSYFDAAGAPMACPFSDERVPTYVLVNSVGTTSSGAKRTFQSYIKLTPNHAQVDGALISNGSMHIVNNFDLYGNTGNNADIYIGTGDYTQGQNSNVRGSVYVPGGSAKMIQSAQIQGQLWSLDEASLTTVAGDVTSTTGTISGGRVGGNAKAAGAITSIVAGTKSPNQAGIANPPTQTFPQITYVPTAWAGYTEHVYSGASACTNARTFVEGTIPAGNHVVRITGGSPCVYTNTNNSLVTFDGNLAIVSDWGIDISERSNWNGVTSMRNLYFITVTQSPLDCSGVNKDIRTGNNTDFNALVHVFFYSPCTLRMANQTAFSGQAIGSPIDISSQFTMTYQPVLVPGFSGVTGFDQDISYVREIV